MEEHILLTLLLAGHDDLIEPYIEKHLGRYGVEVYRENKSKGIIHVATMIWDEVKMKPHHFHG
jgi:hypothetical protein